MSQRWNDLCKTLEGFHRRIKDHGFVAGEFATKLRQHFAQYIGGPDNRRVRVYKVGANALEIRSYVEEPFPTHAVEQTPDNQWVFGIGIVIGPDQFPEFLLRWPL